VDDRAFELHWQKIGDLFVVALYHPPSPLYTTDSILKYIEESIDELHREHPSTSIRLSSPEILINTLTTMLLKGLV